MRKSTIKLVFEIGVIPFTIMHELTPEDLNAVIQLWTMKTRKFTETNLVAFINKHVKGTRAYTVQGYQKMKNYKP